MEIGHKIKKVRELRNYTQDFLATELGITQETYSKIEAGKSTISYQRLEKIAKILGVNAYDLANFDEKYVFNHSFSNQNESKNIFGVYQNNEKLYEKLITQKDKMIEQM